MRKNENYQKQRSAFPGALVTVLILALLVFCGFRFLNEAGIGSWLSVFGKSAGSSEDYPVNPEAAADPGMKGYTNIALFGLDSRAEELQAGNNRSDINIILSINNATGKIRLLSVYRDTFLDIGGGTYIKCNAAYAYGGPGQAVAMLNTNLDLTITDYAAIGFGGLADLVDAAGGVEIDVTEAEIHGINDYASTMAADLKRETPAPVTQPGKQHLNGLQAVAYCRIRYTAGDDYKRTERQREVLSQTMTGLKKVSPGMMRRILSDVLPQMATSLSVSELLSLAMRGTGAEIDASAGWPDAALRTSGMVNGQSCVIPRDLEANVKWLHQFLFGEEDYRVSETVKKISAEIAARTAGI